MRVMRVKARALEERGHGEDAHAPGRLVPGWAIILPRARVRAHEARGGCVFVGARPVLVGVFSEGGLRRYLSSHHFPFATACLSLPPTPTQSLMFLRAPALAGAASTPRLAGTPRRAGAVKVRESERA